MQTGAVSLNNCRVLGSLHSLSLQSFRQRMGSRLWQVWWELWPQTWELPSPLKQNPPHSKLSRRLTGAWKSFAMDSVSPLKTIWLSEIVSTYIVSGCQHFCLTQNSVCQDRSWSSQTYMQERSSRISTIFLSQGREKPRTQYIARLSSVIVSSGECKSWPSKVRQWSGKPGTPSSLFCWPSMTPCLRLLLSRMTWEINSVNEFLGCSMRFGSLPVSNPFLGLLSGRHFRK